MRLATALGVLNRCKPTLLLLAFALCPNGTSAEEGAMFPASALEPRRMLWIYDSTGTERPREELLCGSRATRTARALLGEWVSQEASLECEPQDGLFRCAVHNASSREAVGAMVAKSPRSSRHNLVAVYRYNPWDTSFGEQRRKRAFVERASEIDCTTGPRRVWHPPHRNGLTARIERRLLAGDPHLLEKKIISGNAGITAPDDTDPGTHVFETRAPLAIPVAATIHTACRSCGRTTARCVECSVITGMGCWSWRALFVLTDPHGKMKLRADITGEPVPPPFGQPAAWVTQLEEHLGLNPGAPEKSLHNISSAK